MDLLMSYSGIKAIPESYFEAAQLDGAGFWQTVRHITLPLLKDVAKMCVTISAIGGLFTFPQVYIMTGGGPGDLTTTVTVSYTHLNHDRGRRRRPGRMVGERRKLGDSDPGVQERVTSG